MWFSASYRVGHSRLCPHLLLHGIQARTAAFLLVQPQRGRPLAVPRCKIWAYEFAAQNPARIRSSWFWPPPNCAPGGVARAGLLRVQCGHRTKRVNQMAAHEERHRLVDSVVWKRPPLLPGCGPLALMRSRPRSRFRLEIWRLLWQVSRKSRVEHSEGDFPLWRVGARTAACLYR
jgi:hypothetical protein